jgi:putative toxin-antitoxin system antitoxin component (TIGR02293 family)
MAQVSRVVSDELRRTLRFIGVARQNVVSFTANDAPVLQPKAVDLLAGRLQVDTSILLDVSRIPPRTFQRRQAEGKALSETETDRVLRIARVASLAEGVLGDAEKASRWLSKQNRMLGAKPLELLATDLGTHEVEAELNRIEVGDFA